MRRLNKLNRINKLGNIGCPGMRRHLQVGQTYLIPNKVIDKVNINESNQSTMVQNNVTLVNIKDTSVVIVKDSVGKNYVKRVENIQKELKAIIEKGYVNNFELTNKDKYPYLSKALDELWLKDNKGKKLEAANKDKLILSKWSYQLLLVRLYKDLVNLKHEDFNSEDEFLDKKMLEKELYSKIDPSIRVKLQNRGLCLIQNIYSGYDSEYVNKDPLNNKLLSVQLAVNTQTLLKIPIIKPYNISKVNTLTGSVYNVKGSSVLNISQLETEINILIKDIRNVLGLSIIDKALEKITKTLIKMGVKYIDNGDEYIFSFGRTPINQWFKWVGDQNGYTFKALVEQSVKMVLPDLDSEESFIYAQLKEIYETGSGEDIELDVNLPEDWSTGDKILVTEIPIKEVSEKEIELESLSESELKIFKSITDPFKKYSRSKRTAFTKERVSITKIRNNYIIGHLTNADLSILNDFNEFKEYLDIVNNSLVTLKNSIPLAGVNVYIRDTMLLAPGGSKGLLAIGSLYGDNFNKIDIDKKWYSQMGVYWKEKPEEFKKYAMRDALITLIHGSFMDDFNFSLGRTKLPLTLASLSLSYVLNKWNKDGYSGYQISPEYLLSEQAEMQTPKGLTAVGDLGHYLSYYIANYKGGRNECFMYGKDENTYWYDYDLTSAYTTVMAMLGDPDYSKGKLITEEYLLKMSNKDILFSYIAIKCNFKFPKNVKYPSIPCFADENTAVYPLEGSATLTGSEYLLAKYQGCKFDINKICLIPFKKVKESKEIYDSKGTFLYNKDILVPSYQPFKNIMKELQGERRKYEKGTINNLIYKEIGNSGYGIVTKGISNKMKRDLKTKTSTRIKGNELSNPILSSWITAFTRSLIGELLHNISLLNGYVVSTTTDGFVTNINNLEDTILNDKKLESTLLKEYIVIREWLIDDPNIKPRGLEIKHEGPGIMSWNTRGQFGINNDIIATTGLQRREFSKEALDKILNATMEEVDKSNVFVEKSLRSAIDIWKNGGSVTDSYREKVFRMLFDNRRIIIDDSIEGMGSLKDSKPVLNTSVALLNRFIGKMSSQVSYHKNTHNTPLKTRYNSKLELGIRTFIRGLFSKDYNLDISIFENYKDVVDFIKGYNGYNGSYKINENVIALLKRRPAIKRKIEKTVELEGFVKHIKTKFPDFDEKSFFN